MQPSNMLKILEQHKTSSGITFQEHIRDLVKRLSKDKTKLKGYDHFEILSELLKQTKFVYKIPKTDKEVNNIKENVCELSEWVEKSKRLYNPENWNKQKLHSTILQNIITDSKILEQAGIYLGEQETYNLNFALKKLASKVNTPELRFWGKIFGTKKDYYIAEGYAQAAYADQVPVNMEAKGTGVNKLTFWVTNDCIDFYCFQCICCKVLEEWIELPLVTAEQVSVARKIKCMFTGNLNTKIDKYPIFNGLEKHLLKAQLVRISHGTVIVPRSLYKVQDENDKEIEYEEEFKFPEQSELPALETWQHLHANILNAGRVNHFVDMNLPEEERNTQLDDLQTADPMIDRLKVISEDKPSIEGFENNWLVKTLGETTTHTGIGKEEGQNLFYTTYVLRNLSWPGAFCVAQANTYVNIYIGAGMKQNQLSFFPQTPNNIGIEPIDQTEHPEPNGKDPKILAAEEAERERKRLEELEAEQDG